MKQILKTVIAGAAGAIVAMGALFGGTALAGTGVGAVFNLGQTNTVNGQSVLTGSTPNGAALKIVNTGTATAATALKLQVPSDHPPFVTNGTGKVINLQADTVDGASANELARVAIAAKETLEGSPSTDIQATVSITAPKNGFVRLDGQVTIYDGFQIPNCNDCQVYVRVHDETNGVDSAITFFQGGDGAAFSADTIPVTWVFPVTPGAHTYSLRTAQNAISGNGYDIFNPVLIAQYVPYGGTGSATSLGHSQVKTASDAQEVGH